jgi:RimJ/RimL family protein N-acetyltransferase
MLKLEKYGVCLRQIGPEDLEMVRQWRNSSEVAKYMAYREHITPEMQQNWYDGVCERGDLYFIINVAGKEVGLINLKNIDFIKSESESGIFIADKSFQNTHLIYCASFCLGDFASEVLRLRWGKIHILDDNKRAIRYNLSLGYKPTEEVEAGSNRLYTLEKSDYYKMSAKIKKALQIQSY